MLRNRTDVADLNGKWRRLMLRNRTDVADLKGKWRHSYVAWRQRAAFRRSACLQIAPK